MATPWYRERRVWLVSLVAAAFVASIGAGVVLSANGTPADISQGATLPESQEAAALFAGLSQQGLALGRPDAPVTLVEFVDIQCPYCREFEVEGLPAVLDKHVKAGTLRIEIRGLAFLGPDSERGIRAVLAASQQDKAFELMELLYFNQGHENSGWLSQDLVEAAARSLPGLDPNRLLADMKSSEVDALIASHAAQAERMHVQGTPTLFVGPSGGQLEQVAISSPSDIAAIDQAIAVAKKS